MQTRYFGISTECQQIISYNGIKYHSSKQTNKQKKTTKKKKKKKKKKNDWGHYRCLTSFMVATREGGRGSFLDMV